MNMWNTEMLIIFSMLWAGIKSLNINRFTDTQTQPTSSILEKATETLIMQQDISTKNSNSLHRRHNLDSYAMALFEALTADKLKKQEQTTTTNKPEMSSIRHQSRMSSDYIRQKFREMMVESQQKASRDNTQKGVGLFQFYKVPIQRPRLSGPRMSYSSTR